MDTGSGPTSTTHTALFVRTVATSLCVTAYACARMPSLTSVMATFGTIGIRSGLNARRHSASHVPLDNR